MFTESQKFDLKLTNMTFISSLAVMYTSQKIIDPPCSSVSIVNFEQVNVGWED